jgi:hypothetical protein
MGLFNKLSVERADRRTIRYGNTKLAWEGPFDISIEEQGKTQRFERGLDTKAVEEFNSKIRAWGDKVRNALGPSISSAGIKGSKLMRSIRNTYKEEYGEIFRIGFAFAREGVFVHKGVGRGYVMKGGVVIKTSKTIGFNRKPKPWFNHIIETFIPELEQIIYGYTDTAIINSVRIYIR